MSYSLTFPGSSRRKGCRRTPSAHPTSATRPPASSPQRPGSRRDCQWRSAAGGRTKTYKAICLFNEEATSRPVAAHMLQFAKTAVPHVLG